MIEQDRAFFKKTKRNHSPPVQSNETGQTDRKHTELLLLIAREEREKKNE